MNRDQNEKEHYNIDSWQWIDLRFLGAVKKSLMVSFDSNASNQYGITVPTYVCIDNLDYTFHSTEKREKQLKKEMQLYRRKTFRELYNSDY